MIKVFTFFYNRYSDATTSLALEKNGIEHNVLIHTEKDYELFLQGNITSNKVIFYNYSEKNMC